MSAEQVLRAAIVKQFEGFSYEALAFHLIDSICYRNFCRIPLHKAFKKSSLCNNIKSISSETWEAINGIVLDNAREQGIEKGRESLIDCTVVESNIHAPMDSSLLYDGVRVITRFLTKACEGLQGIRIPFTDHTRRAKRRMLGVQNAKNKKARKRQYQDLLKVTRKTLGYAEILLDELKTAVFINLDESLLALGLQQDLDGYIKLTWQVVDQTERRILHEESVPASEKVVSLFEPHTDIIVKDRRQTYYGHKVCLSSGHSGLITDCFITKGNPADSDLTIDMLDRQERVFGRYPLKVALDGGFASKSNLEKAKGKGIKDVCFAKRRGLKVEDMCRSDYVYSRLRRFRAGIESGISWLKRCFGLDRCTWKGLRSFKSYVWASLVTANLVTIARHLEPQKA
jgi:IS5 family transposase